MITGMLGRSPRMAGDWLKMRHDLADDPAVIRLGSACGIDEDAVLGKLFRLWCWVDRHTTDGRAEGVGAPWVDRLSRCEGFGAALVRVGWLEECDGGLMFPKFHRHCSDTAKQRAQTSERVKRHRNAPSVTEALPEKRREEVPPPPREVSLEVGQEDTWKAFRLAWNKGRGTPWKPSEPPPAWHERSADAGWLKDAGEAIGRLGGCRFFTSPVTLPQFLGPKFVRLCLGGQYDAPKATKGGGQPDKPPPAAWTGDDAERFEATKRAMLEKLRSQAG
jgi:hypothetical protein